MRSFIAIELSEAAIAALSGLQHELKKSGADVRWVRTEGIHLTLRFLGNIEDKDADKIVKIIEGTCKKYTAFNLELRGAGVFPNMKSPRVLWVGVTGNGAFIKLQQEIEDGMASLGFEKEDRRFTPHLTLGRFRSMSGKDALLNAIESHKESRLGVIEVRAVYLMRSDLSPAGAKYTRVAEIPLGSR
ncbi:MAG: RNA 2',3'-cyclic phosphodiesterase [Nitrospirae bacterium]|nr:RNA 2',3'-cyclic phosphodiesterase [Nitrospirota bacterium]